MLRFCKLPFHERVPSAGEIGKFVPAYGIHRKNTAYRLRVQHPGAFHSGNALRGFVFKFSPDNRRRRALLAVKRLFEALTALMPSPCTVFLKWINFLGIGQVPLNCVPAVRITIRSMGRICLGYNKLCSRGWGCFWRFQPVFAESQSFLDALLMHCGQSPASFFWDGCLP